MFKIIIMMIGIIITNLFASTKVSYNETTNKLKIENNDTLNKVNEIYSYTDLFTIKVNQEKTTTKEQSLPPGKYRIRIFNTSNKQIQIIDNLVLGKIENTGFTHSYNNGKIKVNNTSPNGKLFKITIKNIFETDALALDQRCSSLYEGEVIPGVYDVTSYVRNEEGLYIPSKKRIKIGNVKAIENTGFINGYTNGSLTLQNEETEGKGYKYEITDLNGNIVKTLNSSTSQMSVKVNPGVYTVKTQILNEYNQWKPYTKQITVGDIPTIINTGFTNDYTNGSLTLQNEETEGKGYKYEITDHNGNQIKTINTTTPQISLQVNPGVYTIKTQILDYYNQWKPYTKQITVGTVETVEHEGFNVRFYNSNICENNKPLSTIRVTNNQDSEKYIYTIRNGRDIIESVISKSKTRDINVLSDKTYTITTFIYDTEYKKWIKAPLQVVETVSTAGEKSNCLTNIENEGANSLFTAYGVDQCNIKHFPKGKLTITMKNEVNSTNKYKYLLVDTNGNTVINASTDSNKIVVNNISSNEKYTLTTQISQNNKPYVSKTETKLITATQTELNFCSITTTKYVETYNQENKTWTITQKPYRGEKWKTEIYDQIRNKTYNIVSTTNTTTTLKNIEPGRYDVKNYVLNEYGKWIYSTNTVNIGTLDKVINTGFDNTYNDRTKQIDISSKTSNAKSYRYIIEPINGNTRYDSGEIELKTMRQPIEEGTYTIKVMVQNEYNEWLTTTESITIGENQHITNQGFDTYYKEGRIYISSKTPNANGYEYIVTKKSDSTVINSGKISNNIFNSVIETGIYIVKVNIKDEYNKWQPYTKEVTIGEQDKVVIINEGTTNIYNSSSRVFRTTNISKNAKEFYHYLVNDDTGAKYRSGWTSESTWDFNNVEPGNYSIISYVKDHNGNILKNYVQKTLGNPIIYKDFTFNYDINQKILNMTNNTPNATKIYYYAVNKTTGVKYRSGWTSESTWDFNNVEPGNYELTSYIRDHNDKLLKKVKTSLLGGKIINKGATYDYDSSSKSFNVTNLTTGATQFYHYLVNKITGVKYRSGWTSESTWDFNNVEPGKYSVISYIKDYENKVLKVEIDATLGNPIIEEILTNDGYTYNYNETTKELTTTNITKKATQFYHYIKELNTGKKYASNWTTKRMWNFGSIPEGHYVIISYIKDHNGKLLTKHGYHHLGTVTKIPENEGFTYNYKEDIKTLTMTNSTPNVKDFYHYVVNVVTGVKYRSGWTSKNTWNFANVEPGKYKITSYIKDHNAKILKKEQEVTLGNPIVIKIEENEGFTYKYNESTSELTTTNITTKATQFYHYMKNLNTGVKYNSNWTTKRTWNFTSIPQGNYVIVSYIKDHNGKLLSKHGYYYLGSVTEIPENEGFTYNYKEDIKTLTMTNSTPNVKDFYHYAVNVVTGAKYKSEWTSKGTWNFANVEAGKYELTSYIKDHNAKLLKKVQSVILGSNQTLLTHKGITTEYFKNSCDNNNNLEGNLKITSSNTEINYFNYIITDEIGNIVKNVTLNENEYILENINPSKKYFIKIGLKEHLNHEWSYKNYNYTTELTQEQEIICNKVENNGSDIEYTIKTGNFSCTEDNIPYAILNIQNKTLNINKYRYVIENYDGEIIKDYYSYDKNFTYSVPADTTYKVNTYVFDEKTNTYLPFEQQVEVTSTQTDKDNCQPLKDLGVSVTFITNTSGEKCTSEDIPVGKMYLTHLTAGSLSYSFTIKNGQNLVYETSTTSQQITTGNVVHGVVYTVDYSIKDPKTGNWITGSQNVTPEATEKEQKDCQIVNNEGVTYEYIANTSGIRCSENDNPIGTLNLVHGTEEAKSWIIKVYNEAGNLLYEQNNVNRHITLTNLESTKRYLVESSVQDIKKLLWISKENLIIPAGDEESINFCSPISNTGVSWSHTLKQNKDACTESGNLKTVVTLVNNTMDTNKYRFKVIDIKNGNIIYSDENGQNNNKLIIDNVVTNRYYEVITEVYDLKLNKWTGRKVQQINPTASSTEEAHCQQIANAGYKLTFVRSKCSTDRKAIGEITIQNNTSNADEYQFELLNETGVTICKTGEGYYNSKFTCNQEIELGKNYTVVSNILDSKYSVWRDYKTTQKIDFDLDSEYCSLIVDSGNTYSFTMNTKCSGDFKAIGDLKVENKTRKSSTSIEVKLIDKSTGSQVDFKYSNNEKIVYFNDIYSEKDYLIQTRLKDSIYNEWSSWKEENYTTRTPTTSEVNYCTPVTNTGIETSFKAYEPSESSFSSFASTNSICTEDHNPEGRLTITAKSKNVAGYTYLLTTEEGKIIYTQSTPIISDTIVIAGIISNNKYVLQLGLIDQKNGEELKEIFNIIPKPNIDEINLCKEWNNEGVSLEYFPLSGVDSCTNNNLPKGKLKITNKTLNAKDYRILVKEKVSGLILHDNRDLGKNYTEIDNVEDTTVLTITSQLLNKYNGKWESYKEEEKQVIGTIEANNLCLENINEGTKISYTPIKGDNSCTTTNLTKGNLTITHNNTNINEYRFKIFDKVTGNQLNIGNGDSSNDSDILVSNIIDNQIIIIKTWLKNPKNGQWESEKIEEKQISASEADKLYCKKITNNSVNTSFVINKGDNSCTATNRSKGNLTITHSSSEATGFDFRVKKDSTNAIVYSNTSVDKNITLTNLNAGESYTITSRLRNPKTGEWESERSEQVIITESELDKEYCAPLINRNAELTFLALKGDGSCTNDNLVKVDLTITHNNTNESKYKFEVQDNSTGQYITTKTNTSNIEKIENLIENKEYKIKSWLFNPKNGQWESQIEKLITILPSQEDKDYCTDVTNDGLNISYLAYTGNDSCTANHKSKGTLTIENVSNSKSNYSFEVVNKSNNSVVGYQNNTSNTIQVLNVIDGETYIIKSSLYNPRTKELEGYFEEEYIVSQTAVEEDYCKPVANVGSTLSFEAYIGNNSCTTNHKPIGKIIIKNNTDAVSNYRYRLINKSTGNTIISKDSINQLLELDNVITGESYTIQSTLFNDKTGQWESLKAEDITITAQQSELNYCSELINAGNSIIYTPLKGDKSCTTDNKTLGTFNITNNSTTSDGFKGEIRNASGSLLNTTDSQAGQTKNNTTVLKVKDGEELTIKTWLKNNKNGQWEAGKTQIYTVNAPVADKDYCKQIVNTFSISSDVTKNIFKGDNSCTTNHKSKVTLNITSKVLNISKYRYVVKHSTTGNVISDVETTSPTITSDTVIDGEAYDISIYLFNRKTNQFESNSTKTIIIDVPQGDKDYCNELSNEGVTTSYDIYVGDNSCTTENKNYAKLTIKNNSTNTNLWKYQVIDTTNNVQLPIVETSNGQLAGDTINVAKVISNRTYAIKTWLYNNKTGQWEGYEQNIFDFTGTTDDINYCKSLSNTTISYEYTPYKGTLSCTVDHKTKGLLKITNNTQDIQNYKFKVTEENTQKVVYDSTTTTGYMDIPNLVNGRTYTIVSGLYNPKNSKWEGTTTYTHVIESGENDQLYCAAPTNEGTTLGFTSQKGDLSCTGNHEPKGTLVVTNNTESMEKYKFEVFDQTTNDVVNIGNGDTGQTSNQIVVNDLIHGRTYTIKTKLFNLKNGQWESEVSENKTIIANLDDINYCKEPTNDGVVVSTVPLRGNLSCTPDNKPYLKTTVIHNNTDRAKYKYKVKNNATGTIENIGNGDTGIVDTQIILPKLINGQTYTITTELFNPKNGKWESVKTETETVTALASDVTYCSEPTNTGVNVSYVANRGDSACTSSNKPIGVLSISNSSPEVTSYKFKVVSQNTGAVLNYENGFDGVVSGKIDLSGVIAGETYIIDSTLLNPRTGEWESTKQEITTPEVLEVDENYCADIVNNGAEVAYTINKGDYSCTKLHEPVGTVKLTHKSLIAGGYEITFIRKEDSKLLYKTVGISKEAEVPGVVGGKTYIIQTKLLNKKTEQWESQKEQEIVVSPATQEDKDYCNEIVNKGVNTTFLGNQVDGACTLDNKIKGTLTIQHLTLGQDEYKYKVKDTTSGLYLNTSNGFDGVKTSTIDILEIVDQTNLEIETEIFNRKIGVWESGRIDPVMIQATTEEVKFCAPVQNDGVSYVMAAQTGLPTNRCFSDYKPKGQLTITNITDTSEETYQYKFKITNVDSDEEIYTTITAQKTIVIPNLQYGNTYMIRSWLLNTKNNKWESEKQTMLTPLPDNVSQDFCKKITNKGISWEFTGKRGDLSCTSNYTPKGTLTLTQLTAELTQGLSGTSWKIIHKDSNVLKGSFMSIRDDYKVVSVDDLIEGETYIVKSMILDHINDSEWIDYQTEITVPINPIDAEHCTPLKNENVEHIYNTYRGHLSCTNNYANLGDLTITNNTDVNKVRKYRFKVTDQFTGSVLLSEDKTDRNILLNKIEVNKDYLIETEVWDYKNYEWQDPRQVMVKPLPSQEDKDYCVPEVNEGNEFSYTPKKNDLSCTLEYDVLGTYGINNKTSLAVNKYKFIVTDNTTNEVKYNNETSAHHIYIQDMVDERNYTLRTYVWDYKNDTWQDEIQQVIVPSADQVDKSYCDPIQNKRTTFVYAGKTGHYSCTSDYKVKGTLVVTNNTPWPARYHHFVVKYPNGSTYSTMDHSCYTLNYNTCVGRSTNYITFNDIVDGSVYNVETKVWDLRNHSWQELKSDPIVIEASKKEKAYCEKLENQGVRYLFASKKSVDSCTSDYKVRGDLVLINKTTLQFDAMSYKFFVQNAITKEVIYNDDTTSSKITITGVEEGTKLIIKTWVADLKNHEFQDERITEITVEANEEEQLFCEDLLKNNGNSFDFIPFVGTDSCSTDYKAKGDVRINNKDLSQKKYRVIEKATNKIIINEYIPTTVSFSLKTAAASQGRTFEVIDGDTYEISSYIKDKKNSQWKDEKIEIYIPEIPQVAKDKCTQSLNNKSIRYEYIPKKGNDSCTSDYKVKGTVKIMNNTTSSDRYYYKVIDTKNFEIVKETYVNVGANNSNYITIPEVVDGTELLIETKIKNDDKYKNSEYIDYQKKTIMINASEIDKEYCKTKVFTEGVLFTFTPAKEEGSCNSSKKVKGTLKITHTNPNLSKYKYKILNQSSFVKHIDGETTEQEHSFEAEDGDNITVDTSVLNTKTGNWESKITNEYIINAPTVNKDYCTKPLINQGTTQKYFTYNNGGSCTKTGKPKGELVIKHLNRFTNQYKDRVCVNDNYSGASSFNTEYGTLNVTNWDSTYNSCYSYYDKKWQSYYQSTGGYKFYIVNKDTNQVLYNKTHDRRLISTREDKHTVTMSNLVDGTTLSIQTSLYNYKTQQWVAQKTEEIVVTASEEARNSCTNSVVDQGVEARYSVYVGTNSCPNEIPQGSLNIYNTTKGVNNFYFKILNKNTNELYKEYTGANNYIGITNLVSETELLIETKVYNSLTQEWTNVKSTIYTPKATDLEYSKCLETIGNNGVLLSYSRTKSGSSACTDDSKIILTGRFSTKNENSKVKYIVKSLEGDILKEQIREITDSKQYITYDNLIDEKSYKIETFIYDFKTQQWKDKKEQTFTITAMEINKDYCKTIKNAGNKITTMWDTTTNSCDDTINEPKGLITIENLTKFRTYMYQYLGYPYYYKTEIMYGKIKYILYDGAGVKLEEYIAESEDGKWSASKHREFKFNIVSGKEYQVETWVYNNHTNRYEDRITEDITPIAPNYIKERCKKENNQGVDIENLLAIGSYSCTETGKRKLKIKIRSKNLNTDISNGTKIELYDIANNLLETQTTEGTVNQKTFTTILEEDTKYKVVSYIKDNGTLNYVSPIEQIYTPLLTESEKKYCDNNYNNIGVNYTYFVEENCNEDGTVNVQARFKSLSGQYNIPGIQMKIINNNTNEIIMDRNTIQEKTIIAKENDEFKVTTWLFEPRKGIYYGEKEEIFKIVIPSLEKTICSGSEINQGVAVNYYPKKGRESCTIGNKPKATLEIINKTPITKVNKYKFKVTNKLNGKVIFDGESTSSKITLNVEDDGEYEVVSDIYDQRFKKYINSKTETFIRNPSSIDIQYCYITNRGISYTFDSSTHTLKVVGQSEEAMDIKYEITSESGNLLYTGKFYFAEEKTFKDKIISGENIYIKTWTFNARSWQYENETSQLIILEDTGGAIINTNQIKNEGVNINFKMDNYSCSNGKGTLYVEHTTEPTIVSMYSNYSDFPLSYYKINLNVGATEKYPGYTYIGDFSNRDQYKVYKSFSDIPEGAAISIKTDIYDQRKNTWVSATNNYVINFSAEEKAKCNNSAVENKGVYYNFIPVTNVGSCNGTKRKGNFYLSSKTNNLNNDTKIIRARILDKNNNELKSWVTINNNTTNIGVYQEFDELYVETQIYNIVTRNYESTVKDQITLRFLDKDESSKYCDDIVNEGISYYFKGENEPRCKETGVPYGYLRISNNTNNDSMSKVKYIIKDAITQKVLYNNYTTNNYLTIQGVYENQKIDVESSIYNSRKQAYEVSTKEQIVVHGNEDEITFCNEITEDKGFEAQYQTIKGDDSCTSDRKPYVSTTFKTLTPYTKSVQWTIKDTVTNSYLTTNHIGLSKTLTLIQGRTYEVTTRIEDPKTAEYVKTPTSSLLNVPSVNEDLIYCGKQIVNQGTTVKFKINTGVNRCKNETTPYGSAVITHKSEEIENMKTSWVVKREDGSVLYSKTNSNLIIEIPGLYKGEKIIVKTKNWDYKINQWVNEVTEEYIMSATVNEIENCKLPTNKNTISQYMVQKGDNSCTETLLPKGDLKIKHLNEGISNYKYQVTNTTKNETIFNSSSTSSQIILSNQAINNNYEIKTWIYSESNDTWIGGTTQYIVSSATTEELNECKKDIINEGTSMAFTVYQGDSSCTTDYKRKGEIQITNLTSNIQTYKYIIKDKETGTLLYEGAINYNNIKISNLYDGQIIEVTTYLLNFRTGLYVSKKIEEHVVSATQEEKDYCNNNQINKNVTTYLIPYRGDNSCTKDFEPKGYIAITNESENVKIMKLSVYDKTNSKSIYEGTVDKMENIFSGIAEGTEIEIKTAIWEYKSRQYIDEKTKIVFANFTEEDKTYCTSPSITNTGVITVYTPYLEDNSCTTDYKRKAKLTITHNNVGEARYKYYIVDKTTNVVLKDIDQQSNIITTEVIEDHEISIKSLIYNRKIGQYIEEKEDIITVDMTEEETLYCTTPYVNQNTVVEDYVVQKGNNSCTTEYKNKGTLDIVHNNQDMQKYKYIIVNKDTNVLIASRESTNRNQLVADIVEGTNVLIRTFVYDNRNSTWVDMKEVEYLTTSTEKQKEYCRKPVITDIVIAPYNAYQGDGSCTTSHKPKGPVKVSVIEEEGEAYDKYKWKVYKELDGGVLFDKETNNGELYPLDEVEFDVPYIVEGFIYDYKTGEYTDKFFKKFEASSTQEEKDYCQPPVNEGIRFAYNRMTQKLRIENKTLNIGNYKFKVVALSTNTVVLDEISPKNFTEITQILENEEFNVTTQIYDIKSESWVGPKLETIKTLFKKDVYTVAINNKQKRPLHKYGSFDLQIISSNTEIQESILNIDIRNSKNEKCLIDDMGTNRCYIIKTVIDERTIKYTVYGENDTYKYNISTDFPEDYYMENPTGETKIYILNEIFIKNFLEETQRTAYWSNIVGVDEAYNAGFTGLGVQVAIIGEGLNLEHIDLDGQINITLGGDVDYKEKLIGMNRTNGIDKGLVGTVSMDVDGNYFNTKGTAHATIIAGTKDGIGTHGVAYNSKLIQYKINKEDGIYDKIWGYDRLINDINSGNNIPVADLTTISYDQIEINTELRTKINTILDIGTTLITGVGDKGLECTNFGDCNDTAFNILYNNDISAKDGGVIIVGSLNEDTTGISDTSNRAGIFKNNFLLAPGANIYTSTKEGLGYVSGTEFSASIVSGVYALMKEKYPNKTGKEIVQIMFDNAKDMGEVGIDSTYGYGQLDVKKVFNPTGELSSVSLSSNGSMRKGRKIESQEFKTTNRILSNSIKNVTLPVLDEYGRLFNKNAIE